MSASRYQRLQAIFEAVCNVPETERAALLVELCRDDPTLQVEVEALLAADEDEGDPHLVVGAGQHVQRMAADLFATDDAPTQLPRRFGRYEVNGVLGEGGMGVVYDAQQVDPNRRVALKVIREEAATPDLLRRFRMEAQVLGQLQHPGIARIYEANTDGDRPYFVLEYIDGVPIDEYAKNEELDVRDRIRLIAQVYDALHHAHQQGVIHRDLKPGNILVADGQPKILDFGIARATDSDLQAATFHTNAGQILGTLPYMSPEQASGDVEAIDVHSDIYSLGVVAYEVLTGELPYQTSDKPLHKALQTICEESPRPPSKIRRDCRGDIESIINMALEKDLSRRYQTAADVALDIRRYLADEVIIARPVTSMYQIHKFTKRNRSVLFGVTATLIASIGIMLAVLFMMSADDADFHVVPGESIQAALDAADSGDIIELAPGHYRESIVFPAKQITLRSTDPDTPIVVNATVIFGSADSSVITIVGQECSGSTIEGITVRGGNSARGGGFFIEDAGAIELRNVDVRANSTTGFGAGIYSKATDISASGLWMNNNDTVKGHKTTGGAIYCDGGSLTLMDSDILSSDMTMYGGAMFLTGGAVVEIVACELWNNTSARGGAIALAEGATIDISRTIFRDNIALEFGGGAIHCQAGCELNLSNCELRNNEAIKSGGALLLGSAATIMNCTLVGNVPDAVRATGRPAEIQNSIVWNNGEQPFTGNLMCTHSNVQGSFPGTGNIDVDPLFTDPAGNDYSLQAGSPSIDAGNAANYSGSSADLAGNPRQVIGKQKSSEDAERESVIDMGAYEFQQADHGRHSSEQESN